MNKSICLNMIVKNEAHCIADTLINLCSKIQFSHWIISDTGSTDTTKEVITQFFKEKNIPGKIVEHEWKDFGYNRTKALESAFNLTDYLLIFDADDKLEGDFKLPEKMILDKYLLTFGGDGCSYVRPLLVNNHKKWCFKGVIHEALHNLETLNGEMTIPGKYHVVSGRIGARSQNPTKYYDDAIVLKKGFEDEFTKDYNQACRYSFYCGQSYKDAGEKYTDEAIEWYKKTLTLHNWTQEKYYSCLMLGDLYMRKNDKENAKKYWLKSIEYDEERMECISNVMHLLRLEEHHLLVNLLYHKFANYKKAKDLQGKLFMVIPLQNDEIEFHNSISAFYLGKNEHPSGYDCCKKILHNQILQYDKLKLTIPNLLFYKELIAADTLSNITKVFYDVNKVFQLICKKNHQISAESYEVWELLFEKCKKQLTKYNNHFSNKDKETKESKESKEEDKTKNQIVKSKEERKSIPFTNNKTPTIFLSFTTCKRFDLFQQTINSLLNHWPKEEIDKIDYWFCVDDNSSEQNRGYMTKLYHWIDYYMKTPEEKGHRQSMNIIFNKLKELKPTYWIHLEDDFLFFDKMSYISDSLSLLEKLKEMGVNQILFNRNYGETIKDYNILGHMACKEDDSVAIHGYKIGQFPYPNCHYWPHYSFRPSLIKVDAIMTLGNYDTPNQFFEMDYASKWTNAGYKSAFFNKITNKHIGRLTSERNDATKANAYSMNSERQFVGEPTTQMVARPAIQPMQVINLLRRPDRKESTVKVLTDAGIDMSGVDFVEAVDGNKLEPTRELANLFKDNDFGSRRGFIGCALSHYKLWQQLLIDPKNEYYVIMEDDFSLQPNFKERYNKLEEDDHFKMNEVLFLGYTMFSKERNKVENKQIYDNPDTTILTIKPLNKSLYIGGFFMYSINKVGAAKLLSYIQQNGIKHGIDYLIKIIPQLDSKELQPLLCYTEWVETNDAKVDSDIQKDFIGLDFSKIKPVGLDNYIFFPKLDHMGDDLFFNRNSVLECVKLSDSNASCAGFNTLGFFKSVIDTTKLVPSAYFGEKDGLYVKKEYYEMSKKMDMDKIKDKTNEKNRIKMLCNWTNSKQLCKEWSNMCTTPESLSWNDKIQMTFTEKREEIDYYVVINSTTEYYDPLKTIVFQMEPWIYDETKNWGIRTWAPEWSIPDPNKFMHVHSHKKYLNNVQWLLDYPLEQISKKVDKDKTMSNKISCVCSNKNFDEGHILRNNFIKYIEDKKEEREKKENVIEISDSGLEVFGLEVFGLEVFGLEVFGRENYHNFKSYIGQLKDDNKLNGLLPYKYHLSAENNCEHNYATEKIWEPILSECLCFYWGCPNLSEYISPEAYVCLPLNDFAESLKIIKQAVSEDWWSQRIDIIRREKQKILSELAFFPTLEKII